MPGQPFRQHGSRPRQSASDCPFGTAQVQGGFLAGFPFQVAENDHLAMLIGQSFQLLIEHQLKARAVVLGRLGSRDRHRFLHSSFGGSFPSLQSRPVGNAIKPIADRARRVKSGSLANQDQKSDLKSILGIVRIVQEAAANAEDHRPMPANQRLEGRLIALVNVALEQIGVRYPRRIFHRQYAAKMLDYPA